MDKQPNSRMCFVCGIESPIGLHLKFYTEDEGRCIARFRPKPEHQGYPGHLHGGIISTLLAAEIMRLWVPGRSCQSKSAAQQCRDAQQQENGSPGYSVLPLGSVMG